MANGLIIGVNQRNVQWGLNELPEANIRNIGEFIYKTERKNGQRIFGPPMNKIFEFEPDTNNEIHVGNIPKNVFEDDLIPVLTRFGHIYTLKVFFDFNNNNRGFAFVKYFTIEQAEKALVGLKHVYIKRHCLLTTKRCNNNNIIFIGNLNVNRYGLNDLVGIIRNFTVEVKCFKVFAPSGRNRYSATLEFFDHSDAAVFKRKLLSAKHEYFPEKVIISWNSSCSPRTNLVASVFRWNRRQEFSQIIILQEYYDQICK